MYSDHPHLWPPPDDTVLWRYMDFTRFVSLLEKEALFFCRPDLLGDPFEGSLSHVTPPAFPQDLREGPVSVRGFDLRQVVRMARVSCWHMGEFESEAMWRLYARERDGIAIRTDFARFKDAFVGDQEISASVVRYRDYSTDSIPFGTGCYLWFTRGLAFSMSERSVPCFFDIPMRLSRKNMADVTARSTSRRS